jgi:hypothetical protein
MELQKGVIFAVDVKKPSLDTNQSYVLGACNSLLVVIDMSS